MSSNIDLSKPLMPKATAVWLIEHTSLTFSQIAKFCDLHDFEVESIANKPTVIGKSPVKDGLLTQKEIDRCQDDPTADLKSSKRDDIPPPRSRSKGPRYTPVSKRGDKPDAVAYMLKYHPEVSDAQITKLIGTTKNTIQKIRDKSHLNMSNIRPRHPAELGLCNYEELDQASRKGLKAQGKDPDEVGKDVMVNHEEEKQESQKSGTGFDFSNFLGSAGRRQPTAEETIKPHNTSEEDDDDASEDHMSGSIQISKEESSNLIEEVFGSGDEDSSDRD